MTAHGGKTGRRSYKNQREESIRLVCPRQWNKGTSRIRELAPEIIAASKWLSRLPVCIVMTLSDTRTQSHTRTQTLSYSHNILLREHERRRHFGRIPMKVIEIKFGCL